MVALALLLLAVLQTVHGQSCPLSSDTTSVYAFSGDSCRFYRCENGAAVIYRCAYDTVYDDTLKRCVYRANSFSPCGAATSFISNPGCQQCAVGRDMFLPSWDICQSGRFYVCRGGQRYQGSCPSGFANYNSVLGACSDRPDSLSLCTFNLTLATSPRLVMGNPQLAHILPIWKELVKLQSVG